MRRVTLRRRVAAPCSSACRTSLAALPRRRWTRTSRATSAIRSTFRASSTGRTTSRLTAYWNEGRSAGPPFFVAGTLPAACLARLTVNPLARNPAARFSATREANDAGINAISIGGGACRADLRDRGAGDGAGQLLGVRRERLDRARALRSHA